MEHCRPTEMTDGRVPINSCRPRRAETGGGATPTERAMPMRRGRQVTALIAMVMSIGAAVLVLAAAPGAYAQCLHTVLTDPSSVQENRFGASIVTAEAMHPNAFNIMATADPQTRQLRIYHRNANGTWPLNPSWTSPFSQGATSSFGRSIAASTALGADCAIQSPWWAGRYHTVAVGDPDYDGIGAVYVANYRCSGIGALGCQGGISCNTTWQRIDAWGTNWIYYDPGDGFGKSVGVGVRGIAVGVPGKNTVEMYNWLGQPQETIEYWNP